MGSSALSPSIDALVFDAYGTLFDVHSVVRRCDNFWPGKGPALSLAWRAKQLEYTWLRSLMGCYRPFSEVTRDALAQACQALGLPLEPAQVETLMRDYLRLACFPEVPAALARLKGKKLAILSNGSPDMLGPLVEHCGLAFEAVLSVDELGIYKPAPQVYALVLEKLNLKRENVGFVSSNCWDALGAKSFGFTVFWINRSGAPLDRLGFVPDRIIKSLEELASSLGELH